MKVFLCCRQSLEFLSHNRLEQQGANIATRSKAVQHICVYHQSWFRLFALLTASSLASFSASTLSSLRSLLEGNHFSASFSGFFVGGLVMKKDSVGRTMALDCLTGSQASSQLTLCLKPDCYNLFDLFEVRII